jgi:transcription elongation factor GreA
MADNHQLTQAAYDKLRAEHTELTTVARIEVARLIEVARAMGDLKENGDYHAAKDLQGMQESRVRTLEAILKDAEIIEASSDGTISAGSVVSIVYEGDSDDMAETYMLGHIEERGEGITVMTPGSPLGAALLGHKVGDRVTYAANGNELAVIVKSVST